MGVSLSEPFLEEKREDGQLVGYLMVKLREDDLLVGDLCVARFVFTEETPGHTRIDMRDDPNVAHLPPDFQGAIAELVGGIRLLLLRNYGAYR